MKKLIALMLVLLMLAVSLASCKSGGLEKSSGESDTDYGSDTGDAENIGGGTGDIGFSDEESGSDSAEENGEAGGNSNSAVNSYGLEEKQAHTPSKESTSGLKFSLNADGKSYTLVGKGSCKASDVVIDGYKGLPVTKIGYGVFDNDQTLKKVTIGDSVTYIDMYAFAMCKALTSVTMGKNVKVLRDYCFRYCNALTSIKLGNGVEVIGEGVFYNASKLSNVTMPSGIRYIGEHAFNKIAAGGDLASLGTKDFYLGKYLIKIGSKVSGKYTVKDGTLGIAEAAAYGCASITELSVPNSVKSIGNKSFYNTTKLKTIKLGTGIEYIGEQAFNNGGYYNTSGNWKNDLLYIDNYLVAAKSDYSGTCNILPGTKVVAGGTFASCEGLTSVGIPDSVISIGEYAFNNCVSLTNITVGKGVKYIGKCAFRCCATAKNLTLKAPSGWSIDGAGVPEELASDREKAVIMLTVKYYEFEWKRS